ncbi:hypothetical protein AALB16_10320 [Lachnospiraceae bacterium 62-35]
MRSEKCMTGRKNRKKAAGMVLAGALTIAAAQTSLAGWEWIDNNRDGQAGCYYFKEDGTLLRNAVTPDGYRVNENGLWVVNGVVQKKTVAVKLYDMKKDIQAIRDLFAHTNNSLNSYKKVKGYSTEYDYYTNEDETSYYNANNMVIRRTVPRKYNDGLSAEIYYYDPALGAQRASGSSDYEHLAFVFAMDSNGGEYRLYFKDYNIIRYIGPDHVNVDFPAGIGFYEFYMNSSMYNGGDKIWNILAIADPGWWISYEGEGSNEILVE